MDVWLISIHKMNDCFIVEPIAGVFDLCESDDEPSDGGTGARLLYQRASRRRKVDAVAAVACAAGPSDAAGASSAPVPDEASSAPVPDEAEVPKIRKRIQPQEDSSSDEDEAPEAEAEEPEAEEAEGDAEDEEAVGEDEASEDEESSEDEEAAAAAIVARKLERKKRADDYKECLNKYNLEKLDRQEAHARYEEERVKVNAKNLVRLQGIAEEHRIAKAAAERRAARQRRAAEKEEEAEQAEQAKLVEQLATAQAASNAKRKREQAEEKLQAAQTDDSARASDGVATSAQEPDAGRVDAAAFEQFMRDD